MKTKLHVMEEFQKFDREYLGRPVLRNPNVIGSDTFNRPILMEQDLTGSVTRVYLNSQLLRLLP